MPHADRPRIPAPPIRRFIKPTPVVIRRPAPWLVADPRPSIPVFPNPTALTIRRPPIHRDGPPDGSVTRHIHPASVRIEIFHSIDTRAHILATRRSRESLIAAVVPAVPLIRGGCPHNLEFGIGGCTARHQRLTGTNPLGTRRGEDFDFPAPRRHFGFPGIGYGN